MFRSFLCRNRVGTVDDSKAFHSQSAGPSTSTCMKKSTAVPTVSKGIDEPNGLNWVHSPLHSVQETKYTLERNGCTTNSEAREPELVISLEANQSHEHIEHANTTNACITTNGNEHQNIESLHSIFNYGVLQTEQTKKRVQFSDIEDNINANET